MSLRHLSHAGLVSRIFRALVFALALLVVPASPAQAERRLALVVGIADYQDLQSLVKPSADAPAIEGALARIGFETQEVVEADGGRLETAMSRFIATIQPGDTVLVHFTGHGARVEGDFVLLPADAPRAVGSRDDLRGVAAIGLSDLADRLKATGARAQILIVDACRLDPYAPVGSASAGSSCGTLARQAPEGTFVLFSASLGQRALDRLGPDDDDPHSIFTRALLREIPANRSLVDLARAVRDDVANVSRSVGHEQRPAYLDEVSGPPIFLAGDRPLAPPRPRPIPAPEISAPMPLPPPASPAPATAFRCGAFAPGPPAFDCGRARNAVEVAICREPELGSCDRVLNSAFDRAQARLGGSGPGLRREQDEWIADRNACAEIAASSRDALVECAGRLYDRRIAELEGLSSARPAPRVEGPSFSCRNARTSVEQTICASGSLSAKDREMAILFDRAMGTGPGRSGFIDAAQRDWRAARDACARVAPQGAAALESCVEDLYDARIRDLRVTVGAR